MATLSKSQLKAVAEGKMSIDDAMAAMQNDLSLKVGESGGISVYGLQRFPTTLKIEQWEQVLGYADVIRKFAKDNAAVITKNTATRKAEKAAERQAKANEAATELANA